MQGLNDLSTFAAILEQRLDQGGPGQVIATANAVPLERDEAAVPQDRQVLGDVRLRHVQDFPDFAQNPEMFVG